MSLHLAKFGYSNIFFFFFHSLLHFHMKRQIWVAGTSVGICWVVKSGHFNTGARLQLIAEGNLLPSTPPGIEEADKILLEMEMKILSQE